MRASFKKNTLRCDQTFEDASKEIDIKGFLATLAPNVQLGPELENWISENDSCGPGYRLLDNEEVVTFVAGTEEPVEELAELGFYLWLL